MKTVAAQIGTGEYLVFNDDQVLGTLRLLCPEPQTPDSLSGWNEVTQLLLAVSLTLPFVDI